MRAVRVDGSNAVMPRRAYGGGARARARRCSAHTRARMARATMRLFCPVLPRAAHGARRWKMRCRAPEVYVTLRQHKVTLCARLIKRRARRRRYARQRRGTAAASWRRGARARRARLMR